MEGEPISSGISVLALSYKQGILAGAFHNSDGLQVIEDIPEDASFGAMHNLLLTCEPNLVLISARTHPDFIDAVKAEAGVKVCPSQEFSPSLGYSIYECTSDAVAGCIGAISRHLQTVELGPVTTSNLCNFMQLDATAAKALTIFNTTEQPNRATGGTREGLSLFRLFNRCVTAMGSRLLRSWFARPLLKPAEIEARWDQVELFLDEPSLSDSLRKAMSRAGSVKGKLSSLRFDASDFKSIASLAKAAGEISIVLEAAQIDHSLPDLTPISRMLEDHLDVNFAVRSGVDEELDRLRAAYEELPAELTRISRRVAQELRDCHVGALNIIYFPQLGYLIAIPKDRITIPPPPNAFTLVFSSDRLAYYKNHTMHRLDEELGDLHAQIQDRELEIVMSLTKEIKEASSSLMQAESTIAELDCLVALAKCARDFQLVRPTIADEMEFKGLRNLLQEMVTDNFIPNDLCLNGVVVLTGANSSGKSVLLRSVGQAIVLAQMGSFVPATEFKFSPVDRILTRIICQESSLSDAGAFEIDLRQIKRACDRMTPQSLLLVDEFGKGTMTNDGIALFAGLLTHLATEQVQCLAITHFVEIYHQEIVDISSFKWLCMEQHSDGVNLYRVMEGVAETSMAIACARQAGIPEDLLQRAQQLIKLLTSSTPLQDYHLTLPHHEQQLAEDTELIKTLLQLE